MKLHPLFLSALSVFFLSSALLSCRATFVSGSSASGAGSAPQADGPVEVVREQPQVVVVNQPVRVQEARPTIRPATPSVTAKLWAPLVIIASPADAVKQYADGRKYIKSKDGYFYWKGYDHRWYMEENDLKKVRYTDEDYIDWTTKGKQQSHSIAGANDDKNTTRQPGNSAFGLSRGNADIVEKSEKEKNPNHANGIANTGANDDKNTTRQPGNSAFGHSRGYGTIVEKPEKEKNPNHANGLTKEKKENPTRANEMNNAAANEDKNTVGQPGNSAFGHSRGNNNKVDKPEKEKNPNHANGLTKEKEEKERIEKEMKDKKGREEKLVKEKQEKERTEKEMKDKKDREEKLVKEKQEKERIEKEVKDKKDREEKLVKEEEEKDYIEKEVKDKKDTDKKNTGEKGKKPRTEKDAKKGQDKSPKDLVKEKGPKE